MPFIPPISDHEMILVLLSKHTGHACLKVRRYPLDARWAFFLLCSGKGERKRLEMPQNGDIRPTPQKGIFRQYDPAQLFDVSIFTRRFENSVKRHEMRRSNLYVSEGTPFELRYRHE